jgi:hypothetical protein
MCSNIPASPAYGVYISQLIRYARASSNYSDFLKRHLHLRNRLLDQGYKKIRLIRSLLSSNSRYKSKNDADEAVSVVSLTSSSGGYINGRNSAKLELLIDKTSSIYLEFLPLIYPPELEVKETTDTASSASFLDLYLEFDDSGQLSTKMYDKRDDFNFKIINFPNKRRQICYR